MTRPQAPLLAAAVLAAAFAIDAALVASGLTRGFDQAMLTALRQVDLPGVAISPAWTVTLAIWVTMLGAGIARVPATLAGTLVLWIAGRRRDAAILFGAVATGAAALPLLKALFHRARPDPGWRLVVEHHASFPSGHALGSMITYPLLGLLLGALVGMKRPLLLLGIAIALAVGVTRVFLGVHWATDVLGGWLIGGAWTCVAVGLRRGTADR